MSPNSRRHSATAAAPQGTLTAQDLRNEIASWCQQGVNLFGTPDALGLAAAQPKKAAPAPSPETAFALGAMQARTNIALPDLVRVFGRGPTGIEVMIRPIWRTGSLAARFRYTCTLTVMAAQLTAVAGEGPRPVSLEALEEACRRTWQDWRDAARGAAVSEIPRGYVQRQARAVGGLLFDKGTQQVSFSTEGHPEKPWTLTTEARKSCAEAVKEVLPL